MSPQFLRVLPLLSLLAVACHSTPEPKEPRNETRGSFTTAPPMSEEERVTLAAQVDLTRTIAAGLRVGAAMLQLSVERCPTADEVVKAGLLSPALTSRDQWGTPYQISCPPKATQGNPTVSSAGPDLTFGTPDDIVVDDR